MSFSNENWLGLLKSSLRNLLNLNISKHKTSILFDSNSSNNLDYKDFNFVLFTMQPVFKLKYKIWPFLRASQPSLFLFYPYKRGFHLKEVFLSSKLLNRPNRYLCVKQLTFPLFCAPGLLYDLVHCWLFCSRRST